MHAIFKRNNLENWCQHLEAVRGVLKNEKVFQKATESVEKTVSKNIRKAYVGKPIEAVKTDFLKFFEIFSTFFKGNPQLVVTVGHYKQALCQNSYYKKKLALNLD